MTYAVEAYARTTMDQKVDPVWTIIVLTDSKRRASKYAERHHLNGGQELRVVEVSMSKEAQEDCCPYAVEMVPGDENQIRFRHRSEATAFAERFLNTVVSTRRLQKSEQEGSK